MTNREATRALPCSALAAAPIQRASLMRGLVPCSSAFSRWLQHTSLELPAHERHRRPAKRQMPGGLAERAVIAALHQSDPAGWVVADRGDLLLSPGYGRNPTTHPKL